MKGTACYEEDCRVSENDEEHCHAKEDECSFEEEGGASGPWPWRADPRLPEPTIAWDILEILRKHEDTTIVTCTRVASALVNELATKVLFQDVKKKPLSKLPLDYESNQSDYDSKWKLQPKIKLEAALTDIYKGMKVILAKNIDTKNGFFNGMFAVVEDFDENTQCLTVKTRTGKTLGIHPVTEEVEGHSKVTYFPVGVGYACTIPKVQGMTLPHITIWLDKPGCRAAAYVAMTRVPMDDMYFIAGKVCPRHFVMHYRDFIVLISDALS